VTLLAILAAHAIAVPLSPPFPPAELQYILSHSDALLLLHSPKYASKAKEVLSAPFPSPSPNPTPHPHPILFELPKHLGSTSTPEAVSLTGDASFEGGGMMLYTSGTTNRPKGVLLPESALMAQCSSLITAWKYTPQDRLLHVLPLHHIHGTVNAVLTPLLAGSTIEFLFPFNADTVWRRFATPFLSTPLTNGTTPHTNGDTPQTAEEKHKHMSTAPITFFTVVPTVYTRLLSTHSALAEPLATATRKAISPEHMRVSISGSAALPTPVKRAWKDLSHGNVLLERFGMTEVGMALSCGLNYIDRVDGSVGWPLPGVEARLVDTDTHEIIADGHEIDSNGRERQGEIQLRGRSVFTEYWRNPAATAKEFVDDEDGKGKWFKTGDIAVRRPVPSSGQGISGDWAKGPMYFILGRQSADIIKSGGEKVSALEIERELLSLPNVAEAAVLAVPSGKWGHKVGAVIVLHPEHKTQGWKPMEMRRALRDRLANYKIPQVLRIVEEIPRNAMGKVNKKTLVAAVFKDDYSGDEM
jgi:malonyl-CoA/methylmalonyl-CoA synthetase